MSKVILNRVKAGDLELKEKVVSINRVVKTTKGNMPAYHYYDGDDAGAAKLQFAPITWSADGWPELGPLPS